MKLLLGLPATRALLARMAGRQRNSLLDAVVKTNAAECPSAPLCRIERDCSRAGAPVNDSG